MIKNIENHKVLTFLHQFLIYYNKNIDYGNIQMYYSFSWVISYLSMEY